MKDGLGEWRHQRTRRAGETDDEHAGLRGASNDGFFGGDDSEIEVACVVPYACGGKSHFVVIRPGPEDRSMAKRDV